MSHLSGYTIKLNQSFLYLRLALLVYGFALILVFHSFWPLELKWGIALFCLVPLIRLIVYPNPNSTDVAFTYNLTDYALLDQKGEECRYEKANMVLNTPLFFLLKLSHHERSKPKMLVIFIDQLSEEAQSALQRSLL